MFMVFGLPIFNLSEHFKTKPYGQEDRFNRFPMPKMPGNHQLLPGVVYRAKTLSSSFLEAQHQFKQEVAEEWVTIYSLFLTAGLSPRVMIAFTEVLGEDFVQSFRHGPLPVIEFGNIDILSQGFPRDLWTLLPNGQVLMDVSWNNMAQLIGIEMNRLDPAWLQKHGVVDSCYGEGGRLLLRGGVAVVFDQVEKPGLETLLGLQAGKYSLHPAPTQQLTEQGLAVIELPPISATFNDSTSHKTQYGVDNHIDRFFALIEDRQGGLHLLADAQLWSGFSGLNSPPKYDPGQTLKECRRRLKGTGVEFHKIHRITHPLAIGIYQTQEGVVVMGAGEPELQKVVTDLVGEDKVVTSPEPLYRYGAWFYSGIRCLVNEAPDFFADDPPKVLRPAKRLI